MGKKKTKKGCSKAKSSSGTRPDWLELPRDITVSILSRAGGAIEILTTLQRVCKTWRTICKDPLMWMWYTINVNFFSTHKLLKYIGNSSSGIKRLQLMCHSSISDEALSEVASKLPLLEELDISLCHKLSCKSLQVVGLSCPRLNSFKLKNRWLSDFLDFLDFDDFRDDGDALAISRTMHGLRHLQLFGNRLTNYGMRKILDRCPHLVSLDLRHCFNLNLKEDLIRRCALRIKKLRLPYDLIDDYILI